MKYSIKIDLDFIPEEMQEDDECTTPLEYMEFLISELNYRLGHMPLALCEIVVTPIIRDHDI